MNDFFADLEGHLHRAARRRARVRRLTAPAAGALALVAALAVVLALASGTGEPEREVAQPAPRTGCEDRARVPFVLTENFAVLRSPEREVPPEVRSGVDRALPGTGRPDHIYEDGIRLVREDAVGRFWIVPVCVNGTPQLCLAAAVPGAGPDDCADLAGIRRGELATRGALGKGEWYWAVVLPDDETEAAVEIDGARRGGSTQNNLFYVTYGASADEQERARLVLEEDQNLHSPDTDRDAGPPAGCETEYLPLQDGPPPVIQAFPVLQGQGEAPTGVRVDDPRVRRVWGKVARAARFANGLTAVLVPVGFGPCGERTGVLGACLIPLDRAWPAECERLEDDGSQVIALKFANERGETEILGVTTGAVRRVIVDAPARPFDVEAEAGTITATVPEPDPRKVTVRPAEGG